jgi:hypothetical protein
MYWMDIGHHSRPHIHVKYAEHKASVDIKTSQLLPQNLRKNSFLVYKHTPIPSQEGNMEFLRKSQAGKIPPKKLKLVQKWTDLYRDELMDNWELASSGESIFSIPLK